MNQFKYEKSKTNEYNLLDEAVQQILSENYIEALSYLESCEVFLESASKPIKAFMKLTVMHNSSVCLYKLGRIKQAIEYLDSALLHTKQILKASDNATENLRILTYISTLQLQLCALSSQCKQHEKALKHAQNSLKYMKEMFSSLSMLVSQYSFVKKKQKNSNKFIDAISKITLILDKIISKKFDKKIKIYQDEEWVHFFNIGNVMIIQPIFLSEWMAPISLTSQLKNSKVLENICILSTCYFSIAAEMRFLGTNVSTPVDLFTSKQWHEKALAICKSFIPTTCPLYVHIKNSYNKHYSKGKEISETKENSITPIRRIYSKRQSEKPRTSSTKSNRKLIKTLKTPLKSNTPMRKINISKKKISHKALGNTMKISTRDLLLANSMKKGISKNQNQSEAALKEQKLLKTQRYLKPSLSSSSGSEKRNYPVLDKKTNFVLTSNDLYGDYSIRDDEQSNTIVKTSLREDLTSKVVDKDTLNSFLRPEYKSRIMSSTGGKN